MQTESTAEVSVVIVNYNSGAYLERCIRSLLRSDIHLDICVVDNRSSDDSIQKLQSLDDHLTASFHQLAIVENKENLGFSTAVNVGAATTTAPHLFVLNPDCYVHPHTVRSLRDALTETNDGGLIGGLVFNEDGTEQNGCRRNEPTLMRSAVKTLGLTRWFEGVDLRREPLPDSTRLVDAISGSAMLFYRPFFEEIRGMNEQYFLHCEDLDVCRRMRDAGHGVYFAPGVSLFHRQGVSGGTSNRKIESLKHQGMMRYYLQHYGGSSLLAIWLVKLFVWSHFLLKQVKGVVQRLKPGGGKIDIESNVSSDPLFDLPGPNEQNLLMVSGGSSDVGGCFINRMAGGSQKCVLPFRVKAGGENTAYTFWLSHEYFEKAPVQDLPVFDQWVNLAPIWTSDHFMRYFPHHFPKKIVALSSTSIDVKLNSNDAKEQSIVQLLQNGEAALFSKAEEKAATCIILRPTLIYGGPRNKNINLIKRIIATMRVFPVVGESKGKRQPVHIEDVAAACEQVLLTRSLKSVYSIAGAEVLSFRQMIERSFESVGYEPRFITCPESVARALIALFSLIPGFRGVSPGLVDRLQTNQVFSNAQAEEDFGYSPRRFKP